MKDLENGWYLRSDGYMTSEPSYQRIAAMKGDRALENHDRLVFEKYMGGEEVDSRAYFSGKRVEYLESLVLDMYESLWTVSETWAYDLYRDRMTALGIEVIE